MKTILKHLILYSILINASISFSSCKKEEDLKNINIEDKDYSRVELKPTTGLRVAWDYSSLSSLSEKGSMPKIVRYSDSQIVGIYEYNNSIFAKISNDNGSTWEDAFVIFERSSHQGDHGDSKIKFDNLMTLPDLIKTNNGDLIATCSVIYSYTIDKVVTDFPVSILTRRFSITGELEPIQTVYANLGCESPNFLEIPNGIIQLYFSNGIKSESIEYLSSTALYTSFDEQRVEMIYSEDNGITWSSYIREFGPNGIEKKWTGSKEITFRAGKTNKSPSATIIGDKIVLSFDDNRNVTFKPYVIKTSLDDTWPYPINGDSPEKEYAFYELLPEKYFMENTCLLSLPSGESLLAYETDGSRKENTRTLEVAISDTDGINFSKRSAPLSFLKDVKVTDNSLMLYDEETIIALMSYNDKSSKENTPMYMKGYLLNDLQISSYEDTNYPLFIGGISDANLRLGIEVDDSNIHIKAKVQDSSPIIAPLGTQMGDGVLLYIDTENFSLSDVDSGIYKIWISSEGDIISWEGFQGDWKSKVINDIVIASNYDNNIGYNLSISIPKSWFVNTSATGFRFAAGLSNFINDDIGSVEMLSQCYDLRSSSWLNIRF